MSRASTVIRALVLSTAAGALFVPSTAFAADAAAGKQTFITNCSSCHGETGKGDGPIGAVLDPKPRDFSQGAFKFDTDKDGKAGTDTDLNDVVRNGASAYGGSPLMAPWPTLSDTERANVIAYIRSLKQ